MPEGRLRAWRRDRVSRFMKRKVARMLPALSATEQQALEAGDATWERSLFAGAPDWDALLEIPLTRLTAAEQAFLDGPVDTLCGMLDDWKINFEHHGLPDSVWEYLRREGFLGLVIPEQYGGKGFSAWAHSTIVARIGTRSVAAAVSVMVPNSLGPGELLLEHGTDAQKEHWLPRLARGDEIPCFAMTGPLAGSDAASMPDTGIVCRQEVDGESVLGFRVSWDKRYITLAPVATLMGLAFQGRDPDGLLGGEEDLGITLALIPTGTPGVEIGRRHFPNRQAFPNGPTQGRDVFVPIDSVIGERDGVGRGWGMLMEALSAGRSISLPSMSNGALQLSARTSGAYARIRKQFRRPVADFEGVQEKLAPLAADTYLLDAVRHLTTSLVDQGFRPAVLSAISKYHSTERMRSGLDRALDIHGGKGVCDGPSNYLANPYYAVPVSITVEGANILTRSMIIFGQGAIRCHPYLLEEMLAAQEEGEDALDRFDRALFGHLGWLLRTAGRRLRFAITRARFERVPATGILRRYMRELERVSTSFALISDLTLLTLGGGFKTREVLSGRFGDVLAEMFMLAAAIKRFHAEGCPVDDEPLLEWCGETALARIDLQLGRILRNHPSPWLARLIWPLVRPPGRRRHGPRDDLIRRCAGMLSGSTEHRQRLTPLVYVDRDGPVGILERALTASLAAETIEERVPGLDHQMSEAAFGACVRSAVEHAHITEADAEKVMAARRLAMAAIEVDAFSPDLRRREPLELI